MEICELVGAEIVDMSKTQMMIQICDSPDRIKILLNMLQSISIVEVARTGTLALSRCADKE
jgi:acetolactate synthase-1/3 small subunit